MDYNCNTVAIGQPLSSWQQLGLNLVARIHGGREVIFAIDLTDSVGLNDEGRIRLTQIIEDSLKAGDTVYVLPFATEVNPIETEADPLKVPIEFNGKQEDIDNILAAVPFESDLRFKNTDIQQAEAYLYPGLAKLNQCRFSQGKAIKPQSVIWLTDAPLLTEPGITSDVWIETPKKSPFRVANSEKSENRNSWIEALSLEKRSQTIQTDNDREYQLTVVDVDPTVQEFCTPSPGGKETCLVNAYLLKMLWQPASISIAFLLTLFLVVGYFFKLNKRWRLKVTFNSDDTQEQQTCYLKNKQRIAIGVSSLNSIYCPDEQIRGYIIRKGNGLWLKPTRIDFLYLRDRLIEKEEKIESNSFRLNCPQNEKDFEINIKVIK